MNRLSKIILLCIAGIFSALPICSYANKNVLQTDLIVYDKVQADWQGKHYSQIVTTNLKAKIDRVSSDRDRYLFKSSDTNVLNSELGGLDADAFESITTGIIRNNKTGEVHGMAGDSWLIQEVNAHLKALRASNKLTASKVTWDQELPIFDGVLNGRGQNPRVEFYVEQLFEGKDKFLLTYKIENLSVNDPTFKSAQISISGFGIFDHQTGISEGFGRKYVAHIIDNENHEGSLTGTSLSRRFDSTILDLAYKQSDTFKQVFSQYHLDEANIADSVDFKSLDLPPVWCQSIQSLVGFADTNAILYGERQSNPLWIPAFIVFDNISTIGTLATNAIGNSIDAMNQATGGKLITNEVALAIVYGMKENKGIINELEITRSGNAYSRDQAFPAGDVLSLALNPISFKGAAKVVNSAKNLIGRAEAFVPTQVGRQFANSAKNKIGQVATNLNNFDFNAANATVNSANVIARKASDFKDSKFYEILEKYNDSFNDEPSNKEKLLAILEAEIKYSADTPFKPISQALQRESIDAIDSSVTPAQDTNPQAVNTTNNQQPFNSAFQNNTISPYTPNSGLYETTSSQGYYFADYLDNNPVEGAIDSYVQTNNSYTMNNETADPILSAFNTRNSSGPGNLDVYGVLAAANATGTGGACLNPPCTGGWSSTITILNNPDTSQFNRTGFANRGSEFVYWGKISEYHVALGNEVLNMPTLGTATFTHVGGTAPTDSFGNVGVINNPGSVSVNFATGLITLSNLDYTVGGIGYHFGTVSGLPGENSLPLVVPITVSGNGSCAGCLGYVNGTILGTNADFVGVGAAATGVYVGTGSSGAAVSSSTTQVYSR